MYMFTGAVRTRLGYKRTREFTGLVSRDTVVQRWRTTGSLGRETTEGSFITSTTQEDEGSI